MRKIPLREGIAKHHDIAILLNEIIECLQWISPSINPDCGTAEPPSQYLRAGLLAYADGSNWDPGSGEGYYYYNSGSSWTKL